jgi:hypothetical protein
MNSIKSIIWNIRAVFALASLTGPLWMASAEAQIPHYTNGMTGTFGSAGTWSDDAVGMTLSAVTHQYSARFTAYENVMTDRAWQRFAGIDAGTSIEVGIMADNGSGNPSGLYLSSGTLSFGAAGTFVTNVTFGSAVTLTNGMVYHVVTRVTAIPGGQNFNIHSGGSESIRPYDRAVDTNMQHVLRSADSGGSWTPVLRNPYFALANGSQIVAAPGQPVDDTAGNQFTTTGGTGTAAGEQFTIFDKEIPSGLWVAVKDINIAVSSGGSPTADLLLRFRTTDGTILGTATLPAALADGTLRTLPLDQQIELQQGVPYLLTSEFGGSSTSSQFFRFSGVTQTGGPGFGPAGWGGTNFAFAVRSGSANNWSTYTFDTSRPNTDIAFSFQGIVVPEPSALALLAVAGLVFARDRRS